jgi:hypothetical protein
VLTRLAQVMSYGILRVLRCRLIYICNHFTRKGLMAYNAGMERRHSGGAIKIKSGIIKIILTSATLPGAASAACLQDNQFLPRRLCAAVTKQRFY